MSALIHLFKLINIHCYLKLKCDIINNDIINFNNYIFDEIDFNCLNIHNILYILHVLNCTKIVPLKVRGCQCGVPENRGCDHGHLPAVLQRFRLRSAGQSIGLHGPIQAEVSLA